LRRHEIDSVVKLWLAAEVPFSGEGIAVLANAPIATASSRVARIAQVPGPSVVAIRKLSLQYATQDGPLHALSNIDLDIRRGEFVTLIGPSGCGKTTLLRVMADLEAPTSGEIVVNGTSPSQARRDRSYGFVFQAPALFPWRTTLGNVMLPLEIMRLPRSERRQRASEVLKTVGLDAFENKFPWQLSGGMQQRVSIARAMGFRPKLFLMDEPFGALDEITRDNLNVHLSNLWAASDLTVVFVTHSIPEAVFLSSRIVVMSPSPGRVLEIIESDFPRERTLALREELGFQKLSNRVRRALQAAHSYE
jgi:NitT/TauT family transport system ATP-binding protein